MEEKGHNNRVYMLDTIRGVIIIGVVVYHFLFDLYDMFDVNLWWMDSTPINFIRDFGAGVLIFISGISSLLSRNNIKRGIKTLICAALLSIVTYIFVPDNFIFIGILHFLGTMMLLYGIAGKTVNKIPRVFGIAVCLIIFFVIFPLDNGYIGIKGLFTLDIPYELRNSTFEYILGFGGGHLYSADYFPFLPWSFLFLAGTFVGNYVREGRIPSFLYKDICKPISFLGRNTLVIYLLHQPVMCALMMLVAKIIK